MQLIDILEAGRQDFLEAVRGVPKGKASARPSADAWSAVECIEHVAIVEERYVRRIAEGDRIEPKRDSDKELKLFGTVRNRLSKVEAPAPVRPTGRFHTLAEATTAFETARDHTVQLVRERGDTLYGVGAAHPFFGAVNAVELIHVIDAHARRHADQLREMWERKETHSVPARKRTGVKALRRDPPDLPDDLPTCEHVDDLLADTELIEICDTRLAGVQRRDLRAAALRVEGALLDQVQLGGEFGSVLLKDVRLTGCDLSNIRAHRLTLLRVEFRDCRLTGFAATSCEWQDVLVENGDLRYAQLTSGQFRSCEFSRCNLGDVDLQHADLTNAVFRSCDLGRADLQNAKLQKADLRTCQVEGMIVGMGDLRGAIVDPAQAMVFAKLMGLQIL